MKKLKKISLIFIYLFIIGFISSLILISYFSKKITPSLKNYSKSEAKKIITIVINNSISNKLTTSLDIEDIFNTKKDSLTNTTIMNLDTKKITALQNVFNKEISKNLKLVEIGKINSLNINLKELSDIDYEEIKNGLVYYIPAGNLTGSILTNNLGPKIPLKFNMSGDVISQITTDVKEYGINNSLLEVKLKVKASMIITMPFVSEEVTVKTENPLIIKIIQGQTPNYYLK